MVCAAVAGIYLHLRAVPRGEVRVVQALARGRDFKVDDSNLPALTPVPTGVPCAVAPTEESRQ